MTYGAELYGKVLYGEVGTSITPPDENSPNLMDYLPTYWWGIRDMVLLQTSLAEEIGLSRSKINDLHQQSNISTATWGLSLWEQEFGLSTDPSMSDQWRREILKAQIRGHGTVTKTQLIAIASAFSGGEVEVIEYPSEYRFVVRFIGFLGIPPNMAGFISMLDKMKPAHLSYDFEYRFTTWDMLDSLTWEGASLRIWNQLKTYGGA